MLQITRTIDINAPVHDVWKKLAKLDDVENFVDSVTRSYYNTEQKEGVGAARTCDVKGFGTIVEEIIDWKEGETFTYTVEGMPKMVKHAQSKWLLERKSQSETTLSVTNSIETRYGAFGRLMERFALEPKLSRTIAGALKQFKEHVERSQSPAPRNIEQLHAPAV
ncbi:MAG: SRPBCC family protein [Deltaproteobacteria bacterium]|nr:SRPBCC family protein [Deltaproteobacteria bacterium]MBW2403848.1 SRPBCC family protein [Deltaproteobacteria bacterium]MBW2547636.1 SRPBCC family protein [Deltaproteobacteria bacterium]MBW2718340.1 SRPBCC family protein [Deltaproteobacteria bacterium]